MRLLSLRSYLLYVLLGILVLVTVIMRWDKLLSDSGGYGDANRLRVGGKEIVVEFAGEPEERRQGLSGRDNLCGECGMLFTYPSSQRRMYWMKEMNFDLDMVFIDNGKVVETHEDVPAPVEGQDGREIIVVTDLPAEWVLEVNSGWVERNGIEVGDMIDLDIGD